MTGKITQNNINFWLCILQNSKPYKRASKLTVLAVFIMLAVFNHLKFEFKMINICHSSLVNLCSLLCQSYNFQCYTQSNILIFYQLSKYWTALYRLYFSTRYCRILLSNFNKLWSFTNKGSITFFSSNVSTFESQYALCLLYVDWAGKAHTCYVGNSFWPLGMLLLGLPTFIN